ncbi:hypothetical protein N7D90_07865 [Pseudomonas fragi]|uniref:hypothetical protein n=1 Tax=Pseudomonas fragi TaxID=296 RepID=UPI0021BFB412|nr:hypothetical protein [Pseudomonas fragi]UXL40067.1 hypothetical protein N7D90_07865 [Pseudomonas fragi]
MSKFEPKVHQGGNTTPYQKRDNGGGPGNTGGVNPPGGGELEARIAALEKAIPDIKEKLVGISGKVESIEKHSATKADLATLELNVIKWYVATAFAMTGLASAITFGLTKLLAH